MSEITEVIDVGTANIAQLPQCTIEESTFALAVTECNGNVAAAYRMAFGADAQFPLSRGTELLSRPQVAFKIKEITDKIQDAALISVGAHLMELADIRDLAKATGQLKTALNAERSRGEAMGIYQRHDAQNKKGVHGSVNIQINMASEHDVNI